MAEVPADLENMNCHISGNVAKSLKQPMIEDYPTLSKLTLSMRAMLHPLFQGLAEGISEFTFANLFLFQEVHSYRISRLSPDLFVITGRDGNRPFFMLPFGLPQNGMLSELFDRFDHLKAASEIQAGQLIDAGYHVEQDRDNFDYLYSREDLGKLPGRRFHKKKNRVAAFMKNYEYEGRPLLEEYVADCLEILESWRLERKDPGDYLAAKQALEQMEALQLCGGIYYVEHRPAAYCLGEELALGSSFVIHFEKAINVEEYKGLYQFINHCFAAILPDKYQTINREQDLGDPGLRQAKESYHPTCFIKKYIARR